MSSALRRYLVRALSATTALTLPALAHAQEYFPPAPPPIRETIDENGVDLTRGHHGDRAKGVRLLVGESSHCWSQLDHIKL